MANIPISSFTAAANATGIGMSGFSLTGANAQSMLDLAGTWNTSGTPTGLKLNVTDTASNAASLLMDLQVGGSSAFRVTKVGLAFASGAVTVQVAANDTNRLGIINNSGVAIRQAAAFGWGGATDAGGSFDTAIFRDAANTVAQRNGTNAQTFRVYNTFTDASNYERLGVTWSANILTIAAENAGTGSNRGITLLGRAETVIESTLSQVTIRTSGSGRWFVGAGGGLGAVVDNTLDIGASGANRPRFLYLAGGSLTGTQADSSLSITPTWNTTGTPSAIDLNVTDTASNASSNLLNLRVGGGSQFRVRKDGSVEVAGGIGVGSVGGNQNFYAANNIGGGIAGMQQSSAAIIGWVSGAQAVGTADLVIRRDAANTLAQRNGTAAQAFNIYNTFTDASNYERGFVRWTTNILQIGTEALGTGTARRLSLAAANGEISIGDEFGFLSSIFRVTASNRINWSSLDNNVNSGFDDTGLSRNAAGILEVNNGSTGGASIQFIEQTAPAAPATDRVRIYAEDNGAGKTRLMARFATGAAVQIAIEP